MPSNYQGQTQEEKDFNRIRCRVGQALRRAKIDMNCIICGKKNSPIAFNKEDGEKVLFICKKCRHKQIEDGTFKQLVEEKSKYYGEYLSIEEYSSLYLADREYVTQIIVDYMNSDLTQGEFYKEKNISRYKFLQLIEQYREYYPEQDIDKMVKDHMNRIKTRKMQEGLEKVRQQKR